MSYVHKTALVGATLVCEVERIFGIHHACVADPNHSELLGGGAEVVSCILPRSGKLAVTVVDDRLPIDAFQVRALTVVAWLFIPHQRDTHAECHGVGKRWVHARGRHHDRCR